MWLVSRPQYLEIYKYKEVIGISTLFMTVDLLGGVFNVLSLVLKGQFDVLAGTTYALVVVRSSSHIDNLLALNVHYIRYSTASSSCVH